MSRLLKISRLYFHLQRSNKLLNEVCHLGKFAATVTCELSLGDTTTGLIFYPVTWIQYWNQFFRRITVMAPFTAIRQCALTVAVQDLLLFGASERTLQWRSYWHSCRVRLWAMLYFSTKVNRVTQFMPKKYSGKSVEGCWKLRCLCNLQYVLVIKKTGNVRVGYAHVSKDE